MLDMTTRLAGCDHDEPHTDQAACDAEEADLRRLCLQDAGADIADHRADIAHLREEIKAAEQDLANSVREAFEYGGSATKLARIAGLSRERIYQLRDGRR